MKSRSNRTKFNPDTGTYVAVKLDPFYQAFLRHYFNNHEPVFSFPKQSNYRFTELLHSLVCKVPLDYKHQDYEKSHFRIDLPYSPYFSVYSHCHMSEYSQQFFRSKIRGFYQLVLHCFYEETVVKCRMLKKDAVEKFQKKYGLLEFNDDRIFKDLLRYKKAIKIDIEKVYPAPWPRPQYMRKRKSA